MARDARKVACGDFCNLFYKIKRRLASNLPLPSTFSHVTGRTDEEECFFDGCFEHLLAIDAIRLQHTSKWLRGQLEYLLTDALARGASPQMAIEQFISDQSRAVKPTTIFFPLSGIDLKLPIVPSVGGTFRLFNSATIISVIPSIINRPLSIDEIAMINGWNGIPVFEMIVSADHQRAVEIGMSQIERMTDVLKFLASLEFGDNANIEVGVALPGVTATHPILVLSATTWETIQTTREVSLFRLPIDSDLERLFRAHEIEGLIEVLLRLDEEKDDINRLILDAIHWFAIASTSSRTELKILNYTTAGELFFASKRGNNVLSNFADGAGFLLAKDDRESRLSMREQVESLYDLRSRIVHTGAHEQYDYEVVALRRLVRQIFIAVLKHRSTFGSRKKILKWLGDERRKAKPKSWFANALEAIVSPFTGPVHSV